MMCKAKYATTVKQIMPHGAGMLLILRRFYLKTTVRNHEDLCMDAMKRRLTIALT